MRLRFRQTILVASLLIGFAMVSPAVRADVDHVLGIRLENIDKRIISLERLPEIVSDMKTDVAVLKDEMGEVRWMLRGLFALVAGVVVEKVAKARNNKQSLNG